MAAKYPYLLNRNGYFYFRISVPKQLSERFQCKELTYSLSTQCRIEAQSKSLILQHAALLLFGRVKLMSTLSQDQLRLFAKNYFQNSIKRQDILSSAIDVEIEKKPTANREVLNSRKDYLFTSNYLFSNKEHYDSSCAIDLSQPPVLCYDADSVAAQILLEAGHSFSKNSKEHYALKVRVPDIVQALEDRYTSNVVGDWKFDPQYGEKTSSKLSNHWQDFIREQKRSGRFDDTINAKESTYSLWNEILGDLSLCDLTRAHCKAFKDVLCRLTTPFFSFSNALFVLLCVHALEPQKTYTG